jgi:hypothetical protein
VAEAQRRCWRRGAGWMLLCLATTAAGAAGATGAPIVARTAPAPPRGQPPAVPSAYQQADAECGDHEPEETDQSSRSSGIRQAAAHSGGLCRQVRPIRGRRAGRLRRCARVRVVRRLRLRCGLGRRCGCRRGRSFGGSRRPAEVDVGVVPFHAAVDLVLPRDRLSLDDLLTLDDAPMPGAIANDPWLTDWLATRQEHYDSWAASAGAPADLDFTPSHPTPSNDCCANASGRSTTSRQPSTTTSSRVRCGTSGRSRRDRRPRLPRQPVRREPLRRTGSPGRSRCRADARARSGLRTDEKGVLWDRFEELA